MKKLSVLLLAALMLVVVSPTARALDLSTGPASMARFFDANTSIFIALRIDDAYLDTLSGILNRALGNLPPNIAPAQRFDLRAQLEELLTTTQGLNLAEIRSVIGDDVALGVIDIEAFAESSNTSNLRGIAFAVPLRDSETLLSLLRAQNQPTEERAGFTIVRPDRETVIAIGEEVMYIAPEGTDLPLGTRMATLRDSERFQNSAAAMPADRYNIYIYVAYADLFRALERTSAAQGILPSNLTTLLADSITMGATILDDSVLTLDVVSSVTPQQALGVFTTPITPDFAAFIPNGVDLLIWGADLNTYVNYLIDILPEALSAGTGVQPGEFAREVENALSDFTRTTGLNLRTDILSWMTGDFAIYSTLDLEPLVNLLFPAPRNTPAPALSEVPVEFGVVIATNNPTKTAEVVATLSNLLRGALAGAPDVRIEPINESGFRGIELLITVPLAGPSTSFDILLVSNDQLFFFGTTKTAERILAGDNALSDPVFNRALTYAPANVTQFTYTDDEGFAGLLLPVAVALADSILSGQSMQQAAPTILSFLDAVTRVVDHSIIAGGFTDDGFSVSRATIALR